MESPIGAERLTSFIQKEIKELNSPLKNKNCLLLEEENENQIIIISASENSKHLIRITEIFPFKNSVCVFFLR